VPVGIDIDPDYSDWLWAKDPAFRKCLEGGGDRQQMRRASIPRSAFENAIAANTPVCFARFS